MATAESFRRRSRGGTGSDGGEAGTGGVPVRRRRRVGPLSVAVGVCLALAGLSLLLPSSPSYDPWAWIIWGREVAELDLSTRSGPSWKPLPVLATTLLAPFGDAAPELWLLVARASALLSLVMTFRVSRRLAGGGWAGVLAGVVATVGVVLTARWISYAALGSSEPLLVALVLFAVERHLDGARTQAFALGFAAALLRPEVWPFLAMYAVYVWLAEPRSRRLVAALLALLPLLWLLPELWGSGDPFRASNRARDPDASRAVLAERPSLEVLRLSEELVVPPIELAALFGVAAATFFAGARRAARATVVLALGAAGWTGLVAAMAELGYSGNPRYLVPAAALVCVVAGVGGAYVVAGAGALATRLSGRRRLGRLIGIAAALVLVGAAVPQSEPRVREVPDELAALRAQANLYRDLATAIRRAGGPDAVTACGRPFTGKYRVPLVAWYLGLHVGDVKVDPVPPAVVFYARGEPPLTAAEGSFAEIARAGEWVVFASCAGAE